MEGSILSKRSILESALGRKIAYLVILQHLSANIRDANARNAFYVHVLGAQMVRFPSNGCFCQRNDAIDRMIGNIHNQTVVGF